jgi:hypothetical protein
VLSDGHGLVDVETHSDHVRQHGILLGAEHVIDLRVDCGEIVGDLVHGLLHRKLRYEPCGTSQNRWVGQKRSGRPHHFEKSLALSIGCQHSTADTRPRTFHQRVLLERLRGLLGQLHPATRVGRNLRTRLCGTSPGIEDSSEPGQSQIL